MGAGDSGVRLQTIYRLTSHKDASPMVRRRLLWDDESGNIPSSVAYDLESAALRVPARTPKGPHAKARIVGDCLAVTWVSNRWSYRIEVHRPLEPLQLVLSSLA